MHSYIVFVSWESPETPEFVKNVGDIWRVEIELWQGGASLLVGTHKLYLCYAVTP